MSNPISLPPVPNLVLTVPPLQIRHKRFGIHLLPDLHLNNPLTHLPVSPWLVFKPITRFANGGFSILSASSKYLCMRFDPPASVPTPDFTFSPIQSGNGSYDSPQHTNFPFGLDYAPVPDMSGTTYHQLNIWLNKDAYSSGSLGFIHQFGVANSFSDAAAGADTQVGGWTASATLFNLDFRSQEEKHNNSGVELALGQVGASLAGAGFINGRSYSVGSQVEIHYNEMWSMIFSGTVNFAPPPSNPDGSAGFSNAMFTVTFLKTHLIIPSD